MSDKNGMWPWDGGGSNEPLSVELYGGAMSLSSDPWVQSAGTVQEMIVRSRVPRELWFAPAKEARVVPIVDPELAALIATQASWIRTRNGRRVVAETLCVTQSEVWRAEHQKLNPREAKEWKAHLTRLDVPKPHVCTFTVQVFGGDPRRCVILDTPHGTPKGIEPINP